MNISKRCLNTKNRATRLAGSLENGTGYFRELNFADIASEVLILPAGEIRGRDGRWWSLSMESGVAIASKIIRDGVDIVLDFNHGSYDWPANGKAAGWFRADSFRMSDAGLVAMLNLTEAGKAAVEAREYRYISPVLLSHGNDGGDVIGLESVGLVNIPNLAALAALNNQQAGSVPENKEDGMEKEELQKELNAAKGALESLAQERDKLQSDLDAINEQNKKSQIEALVDGAVREGKIAPADKEPMVTLGLHDENALKKLIDGRAANSLNAPATPPEQQHNLKNKALSAEERDLCRQLGLSEEQFLKTKRGE